MDANDRRWAAHLLRRAGFGGTPEEIDTYAALGYEGAVERLLHPGGVDDSATEAALQTLARGLEPAELLADGQALWLWRMMLTRRPLLEKMTLFWHHHFATGFAKVKPPPLMYQQIALFRSLALGNFKDLLLAVAKDPAMIIWLDGTTNIKRHPNENWGRELMELFTLGIGNYSEQDVKEVARAFTGWGINRQTRQFEFHSADHDYGTKTIFGRSGTWDGADVIGMLAPRIETGKLLARKLWRWLINDTPVEAGVTRLAQVYLDSGLNMTALLRALLLSAEFRAEESQFNLIKNPVEFIAGMYKTLGLTRPEFIAAADLRAVRMPGWIAEMMGMGLYNPPNVAGWPGGKNWITPTTYYVRANMTSQVIQMQMSDRPAVDLGPLLGGASDPAAVVDRLLDLFVESAAPPAVRPVLLDYLGGVVDDLKARGLIRLILSSPSYQMG